MPAVTTSSGYIPGTVDTQSRYEETDVDEASVVQHNSPLSIGKKKLLSEEKGSSRRGPGSRVNLVLLQSKFPPSQRGRLINANSLTARTKYPRHNNCTRRLTLPRHAHPW